MAAAAVAPWIRLAPARPAPRAILISTRKTIEGYEYMLVRADKTIAAGDLIGYDDAFVARPLDSTHRGGVGYATHDVRAGDEMWAMIYSPVPVTVKVSSA